MARLDSSAPFVYFAHMMCICGLVPRIFGPGDHERLTSFLDFRGPEVLTSPETIGPMSALEAIPIQSDLVERYAWLNFLPWHQRTKDHAEAWDFDPGDSATLPYLEFQTPELQTP